MFRAAELLGAERMLSGFALLVACVAGVLVVIAMWCRCVCCRASPSVVTSFLPARASVAVGLLLVVMVSLAPLRVTVAALPGRPRAASLSYPSGTHNTWRLNSRV